MVKQSLTVQDGYGEGENRLGFRVKKISPIDSLRSIVYELEHVKSGARILHIHNEDSENLFSVTFPTLPKNHTGVPHILEHVVLSGSKKYPVRDPFFEMVKMSMSTFLNAMTDVDHTLFPVCSNVKQDLFNLADVYFDAVFHPLLSETAFCREGYALIPETTEQGESRLGINGIVYSEMQGAYSSAEAQVLNHIQQQLLAESAYQYDSGGSPDAIPDLTYQEFYDFWATHYHPSCGYFVFYGNIPTDEYLEFLAPRLEEYTRIEPTVLPEIQPKWKEPRTLVKGYSFDPEENQENKTFLTMHWRIGDASDSTLDVDTDVVNQLLFGNEGAVLRRVLMESGLGQDLVGCGDMNIGREKIFSIGLKGANRQDEEAFNALCLKELERLSREGFDDEDVLAAFNQIAYEALEIDASYPLDTFEDALLGWLYGKEPTLFLDSCRRLDECKKRWEEDRDYFRKWVKTYLCDNTHRLLLTVVPDTEQQARFEQSTRERLDRIHAKLSQEQIEALATMAQKVQEESGTPNTQEQLALLPQLKVEDLPEKCSRIDSDVEQVGPVTCLFPNVFSNGLTYVILNFDLSGLPEHLWKYVPRFTDAIEKMGTEQRDYSEMSTLLASVTNGLETSLSFANHVDGQKECPVLRIAFKCLDSQLNDAMELMQEMLFHVNPKSKKRLRTLINQAHTSVRTHMLNGAHRTAKLFALRDFSEQDRHAWEIYGLPQLELLKQIKNDFDGHYETLIEAITDIHRFILNPKRLIVASTCGEKSREIIKTKIEHWLSQMVDSDVVINKKSASVDVDKRCEALAGSIKVSHCFQAFRAPNMTSGNAALFTLGTQFLSQDFFMPELRLKGNAYGAFANYDSLQGLMTFGTFRDPHIVNTLDIFSQAHDFVKQATWTEEDLKHIIIGTAKNYVAPLRPDGVTALVLARHIQGITDEYRQCNYEQMKSASVEQIKGLMNELLEFGQAHSVTCVFSNRQRLSRAEESGKVAFSTIMPIEG